MSINTLDLEKNTFNGEPILQITNIDNVELKDDKQFDDSKPSVNFISLKFKKFIDNFINMSTGSNGNSDINIIPIDPYIFNIKMEEQKKLEQTQQLEQIEENSMDNSDIIYLDKNIKNNNKPFMNIIILMTRNNRKMTDVLSTLFIYVSKGFSLPNLNVIGVRDRIYKIGHLITIVPYIDSNNQLLYKPLKPQLIDSCPTCQKCPEREICPVLDKRPYIIGLASCGAFIIILICILFYIKSKN